MAIIYHHADGTERFIAARALNNITAQVIIDAAFGKTMSPSTRGYHMSTINGVTYVTITITMWDVLIQTRKLAVCFSFAGPCCDWTGDGLEHCIHVHDINGWAANVFCVHNADQVCISQHPWCMHQKNGLRLKNL